MLESLREQVMKKIDVTKEMPDDLLLNIIDTVIIEASKYSAISLDKREEYRKRIFDSMRRLDVLQDLIEDDSITEIMVNGPDDIFYEREGKIYSWDKSIISIKKLEDIVQQTVSKVDRTVNRSSPIVDARMEDGSRVHVILPPIALNGPVMTIRKFPGEPISMEQLIRIGSITKEAAEFLQSLVRRRFNIFISGGTGSGKTTFLNALSESIPSDERIITIEDSAELQIKGIANLVRLEARSANMEGENAVTIRDLIRASLRMRPNRIIVGEVRDSAALDMLQALNTGHSGSISSGHSNSPKDMLSRLETMVLTGEPLPLTAIRDQIGSALDILVHLARNQDGTRQVTSIMEVTGYDKDKDKIGLHALFEAKEGGEVSYAGFKSRARLEAVGELKGKGD